MQKLHVMAACTLALSLMGACAPGEPGPEPWVGPWMEVVELEDATPADAEAGVVGYQSSAYVVAPTCGPAKVTDLRQAVPDDKVIGAMEIDVDHLRRGAMFSDVETLLATEASEALAAMKHCSVPLSKVHGLMVAFSDGDDFMFGVQASNFGAPRTLDCMAKQIEKLSGESPWKRTTAGCATTLEMADGESTGFVVDRDTVLFASKSMVPAVQRRLEGKDRSALDGRLAWARREVDMGDTVWLAANLPPTATAGSPMEGVQRLGMSLDASKGLGVAIGAGFGSTTQAASAASELELGMVQARAMMPLLGLPSSVADSVKIEAKGDMVHMGAFLTRDDLDKLRKAIEAATGGSSSSSAPPPRPKL